MKHRNAKLLLLDSEDSSAALLQEELRHQDFTQVARCDTRVDIAGVLGAFDPDAGDFDLRELHVSQLNCANATANDRLVHEAIAAATAWSHELLEECLAKILTLEGWDLATLAMPPSLRKKTAQSI